MKVFVSSFFQERHENKSQNNSAPMDLSLLLEVAVEGCPLSSPKKATVSVLGVRIASAHGTPRLVATLKP